VDYADSEMPSLPPPSSHAQSSFHQSAFSQPHPHPHSSDQQHQPQQQQQQQVFASSLEEINATLASMSNQQLVDLISQAKALAIANPEQARLMLQSNPQMTFALFQAMLQTNLVEQRIVQQIMHSLPKHSDHNKPEQQQQFSPKAPIDQQQVIKQIMGLTEEQIGALPAEQQSQVRAFRAQYGGSGNIDK
jgi:hypothetical protein